jgi:hypothetical protein
MKRTISLYAYLTVLAINVLGQPANRPRPDGFHGLILNQTTVEQAISIMGQPEKDVVDRLTVSELRKWLDDKYTAKIFRELTLGKVGVFHKIQLSFLEDKLVMIDLDFNKGLPHSKLNLKNLFDVEFFPSGTWYEAKRYPKPATTRQAKAATCICFSVSMGASPFLWRNSDIGT